MRKREFVTYMLLVVSRYQMDKKEGDEKRRGVQRPRDEDGEVRE